MVEAGLEPLPSMAAMRRNIVVRSLSCVLDLLNNVWTQFFMYCAMVVTFQLLVESMRAPQEFFFDKMIADTLVENNFDSALNTFSDIRRIADIYEWGNRGACRASKIISKC